MCRRSIVPATLYLGLSLEKLEWTHETGFSFQRLTMPHSIVTLLPWTKTIGLSFPELFQITIRPKRSNFIFLGIKESEFGFHHDIALHRAIWKSIEPKEYSNIPPMPLSKSKLIAFRQCPRRLWLEVHRRELRDDSGATAGFRVGREVGEVARRVYDPEGKGTLVEVDELGYEEAFRLTASLLERAEGPVFEAALRAKGALAFADVMLPTGSRGEPGWRMLEVKSTTGVKDYHRDDLAIQAWLARRTGIPLTGAGIAHIENTFVYGGDGDYRGLFREVDFTEETRFRDVEVEAWINQALEVADAPEEPAIPMGPQCSDPFDCPFAGWCSRGEPVVECPLSWLPNFNGPRRAAVEALGITDLREVPDAYLSELQKHVRDVTISGETWFDREGAAAALAPHGFPAWFLDFETVMMPVPIWKGTRPYQQIPFQFSLHRLGEDGTRRHEAFLDLSGDDPSAALAASLVAKTGASGPVFAYNAKFERMVIHQLAARFPEWAEPLVAIAARLVDLHPIAKTHFYDPSQHGSWSLKAVLPAIAPDLSYAQLEGVADGEMAVEAYREAIAPETTVERRAKIEGQLLAYCELDTLALVRLWEGFRGKV